MVRFAILSFATLMLKLGFVLEMEMFMLAHSVAVVNDKPVIGVLSLPPIDSYGKLKGYGSHIIVASYVKWLESAGARVVPVEHDASESEIKDLLGQLNGVLFTGGDAVITSTHPVGQAQRTIIDYALDEAANGNVFPVWGTCLGFEGLIIHHGNATLTSTNTTCDVLPIKFSVPKRDSYLLKDIPSYVQSTLTKDSVTINMHHQGLTTKNFRDSKELKENWRELATSKKGNIEFVTMVESRKGHLMGTQFHPEKNGYEFSQKWDTAKGVHSANAVQSMAWFSRRFIDYARQSTHSFSSFDDSDVHQKKLIHTHNLIPPHVEWTFVW